MGPGKVPANYPADWFLLEGNCCNQRRAAAKAHEEELRQAGVTQLMGGKQALVQRTAIIQKFT